MNSPESDAEKPKLAADKSKSGAYKSKSGTFKVKSGAFKKPESGPGTLAPKLEDLITDLVALDQSGSSGALLDRASSPAAASDSSVRKGLPADISSELHLPSQPQALFQSLLVYYKNHRHNPLIFLTSGRIAYLEYDMEMERIRLFMGSKKQYRRMVKGVNETGGLLVIDEMYELQSESSGLRKTVVERCRQGRELLSIKEAADQSLMPVLHFTVFNQAHAGISSCKLRSGRALSGISRFF
jgi:hypothetical protein